MKLWEKSLARMTGNDAGERDGRVRTYHVKFSNLDHQASPRRMIDTPTAFEVERNSHPEERLHGSQVTVGRLQGLAPLRGERGEPRLH